MSIGVASGVKQLQERLANQLALPFLDIFKDCPLKSILEFPLRVFRKRIFTPGVTLLAFVSQLLDSDHSCSRAVSRVINHHVGLSGRAAPSTDTGAYVKARQRLPERWLTEVLGWTHQRIEQEIRQESLWLGRHRVLSADGSSAQTPDTPKNRNAFGLPGSVKPGCGLPVVYFSGLFCLASGLLVDVLFQPKGGATSSASSGAP